MRHIQLTIFMLMTLSSFAHADRTALGGDSSESNFAKQEIQGSSLLPTKEQNLTRARICLATAILKGNIESCRDKVFLSREEFDKQVAIVRTELEASQEPDTNYTILGNGVIKTALFCDAIVLSPEGSNFRTWRIGIGGATESEWYAAVTDITSRSGYVLAGYRKCSGGG